MSATAEVRASRLVARRARFVARTVLALALALDVRALTRGPVPAQEFAALVRVVRTRSGASLATGRESAVRFQGMVEEKP